MIKKECNKPIIDILLILKDSADEPSYVSALEAAGYRLLIREPNIACLKDLTLTLTADSIASRAMEAMEYLPTLLALCKMALTWTTSGGFVKV